MYDFPQATHAIPAQLILTNNKSLSCMFHSVKLTKQPIYLFYDCKDINEDKLLTALTDKKI